MPTDDERREVARRLRGQAKKLGPNMDAHEFAHYTADVIDVNECMTWYEMTLLLADLIDPTRQCPHYHSDRHYCSVHDDAIIDRDALLALADDLDYAGSAVENVAYIDQTFHESARRIREALGVEHV